MGRSRTTPEAGFSLVECVVALGLVTLVMLFAGSSLVQAARADRASAGRATADAVAGDTLESLRAVPWAAVGFYTTDTGYAATAAGEPTVTLTGQRDPRSPSPAPRDVTAAGVAYRVTTRVTWATDTTANPTAPADGYRYKREVVVVEWNVGGATYMTSATALRSPSPADQTPPRANASASPSTSPSPSPSASVPAAPSPSASPSGSPPASPVPVVNDSGNYIYSPTVTPQAQQLDAARKTTVAIATTVRTSVNPAGGAPTVRILGFNGIPYATRTMVNANGAGTLWTYTWPVGEGPLPTGRIEVDFQAKSTRTGGLKMAWTYTDLSYAATGPVDIKYTGLTRLSGAAVTAVCVAANRTVLAQYRVTVDATGTDGSGTVTASYTDPDTGPQPLDASSSGPTAFYASILSGSTLTGSVTVYTVTATRPADGAIASVTITVPIVVSSNGASSGCPAGTI